MFNFGSGLRRLLVIMGLFACSVLVVHCTPGDQKPAQQQKEETSKRALEDVPELADAMGQMQYYLHKYALAVDAQNHELATFYFHEVRAASDGIKENIPGYEGYDIKRFMKLFLDPTLEPIETALANKKWDEVRTKTIDMVSSCNSCHNATAHGFVKVTPGFDNNPYNQDFSSGE
jgi:cytochrome c556